jgi:hypothetical protein
MCTRNVLSALITAAFCLLVSSARGQSPWTPQKGHGYSQLSFNLIGPYQKLYLAGGGNQELNRKISDYTLQAYAEWGLTDRTALIVSVPWKIVKSGEEVNGAVSTLPMASLSAFGNVEWGIRQNFIQKKVVFSGQLLIEGRTARFDAGSGLRSGYDAWAFVPSLSIGQGTDRLYGYVSAGTGIRTHQYSSDYRLNAEGGYKLFKRWWIIAVLNYRGSFKNGTVDLPESNRLTGLYVNDQTFFAYGLKTILEFNARWGLNAAAYGATSGNYVAKAPSLNAGIYYKW